MPNGNIHRFSAALTVGGIIGYREARSNSNTTRPITGAMIAAIATNLPDVLEPAVHPHHRQFFHSLAFCGMLGWGTYELYKWNPDDYWKKDVRFFLLVACGAVLIHLVLDSFTRRSLPFIGNG